MGETAPKRLRRRETLCGLAICAVALGALLEARGYAFGSAARMGPGFLPVVYAAILGALGLGIGAVGWRDRAAVEAPALLPMLSVAAALLCWIWLAPRAGFFLATVALVLIASLAQGRPRAGEVLALALGTAAATALVFVGIFALPLPLWPRS